MEARRIPLHALRPALAALLGTWLLGGGLAWADPVGVAAAIHGSVEVLRAPDPARPVRGGEPIWLGDEIVTGPGATLQILLRDETVFTVGPGSRLVIDEFVYEPADDSGRVRARLLDGVFRFVTGRIARRRPEAMEVELPAGNLGIRGTLVAVRADGATGESVVVLLGPGAGRDPGAREGALEVEHLGVSRWIGRSGFAVRIPDASTPPGPPFAPTPGDLAFLESLVVAPTRAPGRRPPVPGAGPAAERAGGRVKSAGLRLAAPAEAARRELGALGSLLQDQAQGGIFEQPGSGLPPEPMAGLHPATFDELRFLATTFGGRYEWFPTPSPVASLSDGGTYEPFVALDFGLEQVELLVRNVSSPTLATVGTGSLALTANLFAGKGGVASYRLQGLYQEASTGCLAGCPVDARLDFSSQGADLARFLDFFLSISNGLGTVTDGGPPGEPAPPTRVVPP